MAMDYSAKFTRWDGARGERRTTAPQWLIAEGFDDAYKQAQRMLQGMRAVDPDRTYEIAAVEARGLQGIQCRDGAYPFESDEEYEARQEAEIAAAKGALQ